MLTAVLEILQVRFYGMGFRAEVAVGEIIRQGLSLSLVVNFRRRNDIYYVITAYPI